MTIYCLTWFADGSSPVKVRYFTSKDTAAKYQAQHQDAYKVIGITNSTAVINEIKIE